MKKILTIILDGFGMKEDAYGNAVKNAGMNNFINIWNSYPHCLLKASGQSIGLPEDQCGSSELGHQIIGAGRMIDNNLSEINDFFKKEKYKYNDKFNKMINNLKNNNLHIMILFSKGGVSSHIDHLKMFLDVIKEKNIKNNIYLHLIGDGKDSNQHDLLKNLDEIKAYLTENIQIASICGRYYAMDITRDYKRTKMYYELLFEGKAVETDELEKIIKICYSKKMTDEYIPAIKTSKFMNIRENDTLLSLNFSRENQRSIIHTFLDPDFVEFKTSQPNFNFYSLTAIDEKLSGNYMLEVTKNKNTLCEYISDLGLSQARIFENIKKTSMCYYLDGKRKLDLENCELYSVETPVVTTYDKKPELNALTIAKTIIKCMEKDYDFIIANFANPDIIGHTGNYQATINSLQAVDVCLGKIMEVAKDNFYKVIILGSHANADTIIDRNNEIVTANTNNPVPFIIVDKKVKLKNGNLTMAAPTILKYMDISLPKEMKETETLL